MLHGTSGMEGIAQRKSTSRYWDARFKRYVVKLLPGEYYVGNGDEMIVTVLGSCIAACIYERVLSIGGMNHFMLPSRKFPTRDHDDSVTNYNSLASRYGNVAMERLINEIIKKGGKRCNLEVKIFGGARITNSSTDIGAGNIAFVREYLELEGITVVNEDVGGSLPRKVFYIPSSNDVFVKKIEKTDYGKIIAKEKDYQSTLKDEEVKGKVFFLDD